MAISLRYLILAVRHDAGMESQIARNYYARAARWQTVAYNWTESDLSAKMSREH
jgi:hypothetical protein